MKLDPIAKPIRIRLSYTDKREFASLESLKHSFDLDEVRGLLDTLVETKRRNFFVQENRNLQEEPG